MSLILEALRKLEREKQVPEPGLVVVGHTPWTSGAPGRSRTGFAVLAGVLVAAGVAVGMWLGRPREVRVASATPATTARAMPVEAVAAAGAPSRAGGSVDTSLSPSPTATPGAATDMPPLASPASDPGGPRESTPSSPPSAVAPTSGSSGSAPRESEADAVQRPLPRETTMIRPSAAAPHRAASEAPAEPIVPVPTPLPRGLAQGHRTPSGGDELKLQAISQRDGRPVAVINERLVREGESFDGVLVIQIRKSEVEVEVGGRRRTLKF